MEGTLPIYMKVDGIDGGANYLGERGWSEVLSFARHVTSPSTNSTRGGAAGGRPSNVYVTRTVDFMSPKLREAYASGKLILCVIIDDVVTAEGITIRQTLREVVVSSVRLTTEPGTTEIVGFNCGEIKWSHFPSPKHSDPARSRPSLLVRKTST